MATKLFTCENSSDYHQSRQTIIPVLGTRGNLLHSTSVKWGNIVSQLKSCVQILALVASRVLQKAHVPWLAVCTECSGHKYQKDRVPTDQGIQGKF